MVKKEKILKLVLQYLDEKYEVLKRSAMDAKDAATNEESKAENKYDTRGLEASYLAGAQAKRTEELKESIFLLKKIKPELLVPKENISLYSLVHVQIEDEIEKFFFVLPVQGGVSVNDGKNDVHTITLSSPLGKLLYNKQEGDDFEMKVGSEFKYYEILNIS